MQYAMGGKVKNGKKMMYGKGGMVKYGKKCK